MKTTPSEIAKSQLVQLLRDTFKPFELQAFIKAFSPSVYEDFSWSTYDDNYVAVVSACVRHGVLDAAFFIGLHLCRPARSKDISGLMSHFGADPETLTSLGFIAPSLRISKSFAIMTTCSLLGICIGLAVGAINAAALASSQSVIQTRMLLPIVQAELDDCNERYGAESKACAQLAEAIASADRIPGEDSKIISTTSKLHRKGRASESLDIALSAYLEHKKAEQLTLQADLFTCRSDLANADLIASDSLSRPKPIASVNSDWTTPTAEPTPTSTECPPPIHECNCPGELMPINRVHRETSDPTSGSIQKGIFLPVGGGQ